MKHGPVTKLDNRNTATSKKTDGYMSADCDVKICLFSDLWLIWSHPKAVFRTHGL